MSYKQHGWRHGPNGTDPTPASAGGVVEFLDLWSKAEDTQTISSGTTKQLHFNNISSTSSTWYDLYYNFSPAVSPPYDEVYVDPGRYHIIGWANIQPLNTSGGALVAQWMGMQLDAHDTITFPSPQWGRIMDSASFSSLPGSGPGSPANVGYFNIATGATFDVGAGSNQGDITLSAIRESTGTSLTWNNYCGLTIAKLA